jgi:TRAP-type C4-dicarboxylate transport system permease large subunit
VNLFAAAQVAGIPIDRMIPYLGVFIAVVLGCLMVVTYVPALSLLLPELVFR